MSIEDQKLLRKAVLMYLAHTDELEIEAKSTKTFNFIASGVSDYDKNDDFKIWGLYGKYALSCYCKLFLNRLEDLNDKLKEEFNKFYFYDNDGFLVSVDSNEFNYFTDYSGDFPQKIIEFYLKNHGDIFGLIDKGLAIDKNTR